MTAILTGTLTVELPPSQAFRLFTPRGEQDWAAGWRPRFPAPTDDDSAPGTVFETTAHGHTTTWVVVDRTPGTRVRYARSTPGLTAGTVAVRLDSAGNGHSRVEVTYALTAVTDAGRRWLDDFAPEYANFLAGWQVAIAASLAR
jgi:hypothetical protein